MLMRLCAREDNAYTYIHVGKRKGDATRASVEYALFVPSSAPRGQFEQILISISHIFPHIAYVDHQLCLVNSERC